MTRLVIVPEALRAAIDEAIDKELAGRPCDLGERDDIFRALLTYFDQHGTIPEFTLKAAMQAAEEHRNNE